MRARRARRGDENGGQRVAYEIAPRHPEATRSQKEKAIERYLVGTQRNVWRGYDGRPIKGRKGLTGP